jgi:hypothetical protein
MEKLIKQTISHYLELKADFINKRAEVDRLYSEFSEAIRSKKEEVDRLESELSHYEMHNFPKVFIVEVQEKKSGAKYLRAVVRFYMEGERKQQSTTIHLGMSRDYPLGVNDPFLIEKAQYKAVEYLLKKKTKNIK